MIQERNYSQENYQKLHPIERRIFDMMAPQNGVVMLQGKPGIGKTAIVRSIARKLKFQFFEFPGTHARLHHFHQRLFIRITFCNHL